MNPTAIAARPGDPPRCAVVLVLAGIVPARWPEPLQACVAGGRLQVEVATSLHAAAARLVRGRGACIGVLVDGATLSLREKHMLSILQRHTALPFWSLPSARGDARVAGTGAWREACRAFESIQNAHTPEPAQGSKSFDQKEEKSHRGGTDAYIAPAVPEKDEPVPYNRPEKTAETHTEIPVAHGVNAGYDEDGSAPLLTEHEIRALLGSE